MKKVLLAIALLLLTFGILSAQTPQAQVRKYYDDSQLELIKKMPKPLMRIYEFMHRRAYPYDNVPDGVRVKAIQQMDGMMHSKDVKAITLAQQPVWSPIGPYDVGGRIKSIAVDPATEGTVYIGAAAGGIWKTTDGGTSWVPIFDYENGIAFGALAIDPNKPNVIYAGTGEAVGGAGGGKNGGTPIYLGAGMFKSTDAGTSWQLIGLTNVGTFSKVCVHPQNSNLVFAGGAYTGPGFYRSTDAGTTWEQTFTNTVTDITINPTNVNEVAIGVLNDGVYFSNDGGKTWNKRNTGLPTGMGRIAVQMAQSKPATMYLLTEYNSAAVIFKSIDKGMTWSQVYQGDGNFFNGQSWYDMYIAINPTNDNVVLAGGIDTWKTADGGKNWANTTNGYSGGSTHVDHHCAAFDPLSPSYVYLGNDGGIYRSNNMGDSWMPENNNLQVTQFYSLAIDNSRANRNYGGTQDNGTLGNLTPDQWSNIIGGDGFRVVVDPNNPNTVYGESQYGSLVRLNVSTMSRKSITNGIPSADQGLFDSPLYMDPNTNFLYSGRHALYVSINNGDSWDVVLSQRTNQINTIASSITDPSIIYCGTTVGELFVTTDGGANGDASWKDVSQNGLVNRFVTDIEPSLTDPNTVFVSFSGYGSSHIFKSTDLGKSWKSIDKDLPDVPVNALTLHPNNANWIFAATDVGVFATFDGGNSWVPYGRGLPRSPVHDISFHTNRTILPQLTLRVATHGRSMWEVDVPSDPITEPAIVSPAGGEIFIGGSKVTISWYGIGTTPLKLEYSTDNGNSWYLIVNNITGTDYNWTVPSDKIGFLCRVRISDATTDAQSGNKGNNLQGGVTLISRTFTINKLVRGSVLLNGSVKFVPYGVAYDGKGGLWTTSFYGSKLYKLNADNFAMIKSVDLLGDSLFTDISYDKQNNVMWLHHMLSTSGIGGGEVIEIDTTGKVIKSFKSPAKGYPIGLELVDGNLLIGDRDGSRMLYTVNPVTGVTLASVKNPYQKTYGPRGIAYDGHQYVYQVCTDFPNGGSLNESLIMKIDKNNLGAEVDRLPLQSRTTGIINGRGIDFDPRDSSFWITDFGGNLYKIAGFNPSIQLSGFDLTISGLNLVCQYDTAMYITPNEKNVTISWRADNGSIIGSNSDSVMKVIWDNAGSGNVVLIKTNTATLKKDSATLNVTINDIPPKPVITKNFNTLISSSSTGNQWYKDGNPIQGATNNTYDATQNGTYKVQVTLNSCPSFFSDEYDFVLTSSDFDLTITGNNQVCQNDTLTYSTINEKSVTISWRADNGSVIGTNNDSVLKVIWNNLGTGTIVLIKENTSLGKKDSSLLNITINEVPPKPVITKNNDTLISSSLTGNQWYKDGNLIPGATGNTYNPSEDGTYTLKVTLNGCPSLSSDGYHFITGVSEQASETGILDTRIFPNPMTEFAIVSFRLQSSDAQVKVQIYNVLGELEGTFFNKKLQEGQAEYFQISAGRLIPGIYIVAFYVDGRQVEVQKMVVVR